MQRYDIAIAGGGITGRALALTVKRLLGGALSVALIERPEAGSSDRAFAFSAGSCRLLQVLGLWEMIEPEAQPINDMVITDSRLDDPVRPVFLTFAGEAAEGEPFAYMIPEQTVLDALRRALSSSGVERIEGEAVSCRSGEGFAELILSDGRHLHASLTVASDGSKSKLREEAGIGWFHWSYRQSGIVATIGIEREHEGRAEEHFLPSGPFAVLPLTGRRFTMVWTEKTDRVERLLSRGEAAIIEEIERRVGYRLGKLTLLTKPSAYPLGFGIARRFGSGRMVLLGDAAHLIHPIAGQGLNLGLRDVAALAEILSDQAALGLDVGDVTLIDAYERSRRADTVAMSLVTDGLNRLFANDAAPLRLLRDVGLGIVDRLPSLKSRLIRQAAALDESMPRLMRGETLTGFQVGPFS
jgi:2-octaprenyl-6-methoxyphenol hydroxylase